MNDLETLQKCFGEAKRGDRIIYHTGYLSRERSLVGKTVKSKAIAKKVDAIGDYFYDLYSWGLAILVQRRSDAPFHTSYGPFIHDYIAIKK